MNKETVNLLCKQFGISMDTIKLVETAEAEIQPVFRRYDDIAEYNQLKVLKAFHDCRISDTVFAWNNGYGHDDPGRDACSRVYAGALGAEDCIVRPTICDGTHALACTFLGILRPGDELLYCSGQPYDTMQTVIGLRGDGNGSLKSYGVSFAQVDLTPENNIDLEAVKAAIGPKTRMAALQRSLGYSWRHAFSIEEIAAWVSACKSVKPDIICMVDNCYGEFLDYKEPTEVGVDVMAGSLMKNPGGGIAEGGGYIAGRADLVEMVSYRVTAPGIGGDCGLMYDQTRHILKGIFMGPRTINGAIKGAALCSKVFQLLGFETTPRAEAPRNDIVTAIKLNNKEQLIEFCRAIQSAAAINAHFTPEEGEMPGYPDAVIMASGSFAQGSTLELSADGPIREPYRVYFQGGLSYWHSKLGVMAAVQALCSRGLIG